MLHHCKLSHHWSKPISAQRCEEWLTTIQIHYSSDKKECTMFLLKRYILCYTYRNIHTDNVTILQRSTVWYTMYSHIINRSTHRLGKLFVVERGRVRSKRNSSLVYYLVNIFCSDTMILSLAVLRTFLAVLHAVLMRAICFSVLISVEWGGSGTLPVWA